MYTASSTSNMSLESHYSVINTTPVFSSAKYFACPSLAIPSWNLVGLSVDKGHWVAFLFALFLLVVVVQVLVTSHSLSEGASHFQSVLQIIYQTVCQPHRCESITPSNDSLQLSRSCMHIHVYCALRHHAIWPHLTYLVSSISHALVHWPLDQAQGTSLPRKG